MKNEETINMIIFYEKKIAELESELKITKAAAARGGITEEDLEIMAKEYEFHFQEQQPKEAKGE